MPDVLATLDPEGVDVAISRLLRLAVGADDTAARIAGMAGAVPSWRGSAAEAAALSAHDAAGRAGQVADLGSRAAIALAAYGEAARRAALQHRQLERSEQRIGEERWALAAAGLPAEDTAARAAAVARQRDAAREELTEAAHRCARTLRGLRLEVADRPRSGQDHVGEGVAAFWGGTVGGVVDAAGEHGSAIADDPIAGIVGLWRASAGATVQALTDPTETAKDAVGWDAWAAGHWGAGAGTVAAAVSAKGLGKGRRLTGAPGGAGKTKAPWVPGYPDGPLPAAQPLDDLFLHVDLSRHEHVTLGHVLTRHVDIDLDYLKARIWSGTLQASGRRTAHHAPASMWADQATAEREIRTVLRQHEARVRAFAASGERWSDDFVGHLDPALGAGIVLERSGPRFRTLTATTAVVRLARAPDSSVYIATAFPRIDS